MKILPLVLIPALVLVSCSSGPGTEEDLVETLSRSETVSVEQAECIAAGVFAEYGDSEDALNRLTGQDYAEIEAAAQADEVAGPQAEDTTDTTADPLLGFDEFYADLVEGCL